LGIASRGDHIDIERANPKRRVFKNITVKPVDKVKNGIITDIAITFVFKNDKVVL
jgi:hypothetical protein